MSKVYWIKGRATGALRSIITKMDALLSLEGLSKLIEEELSLAFKINFSELGYYHYLPPVIPTTLFEKVRDMGAKPLITDSGSISRGSRFLGDDCLNTAMVNGYSLGESFDNQIMLVGGYTNEEGKFYECEGENLGGVEIGSLVTDSGAIAVASHVTLHPILGLAGAIYNTGLGLLTRTGKLRIHEEIEMEYHAEKCDNCQFCIPYCPTGAVSAGEPKINFDSRLCNNCLGCFMACPHSAFGIKQEGIPIYQESVVESAETVIRNLAGGAFFINFLSSVTVQTDEYPYSHQPIVPDLGILASEDPLALDIATYQMILRSPGIPGSAAQDFNVLEKGKDKITAITGCSPEHMFAYAKKMKLGDTEIELSIIS